MGPIGLESLLEYFIFLRFLGGGRTPNPPQEKIITHEFSHHEISNPPFQNPISTHSGLKYHSTEQGNPIKGLLNKIHSIVTQPGKIEGGGGLKRLYANVHGVVKTLWTVGQWFDIIIIVACLL